jgi:hypothetical protein
MEHITDVAQPLGHERSAGELVKLMSEQVSLLVRDELKLARLEMARKGKQAGAGAGLLAGSGLIALCSLGCLLACAIIALSTVVPAWLAALIVGAALLTAATAAALAGRGRLRKAAPPLPEEAMDSFKSDVDEIKEKVRR